MTTQSALRGEKLQNDGALQMSPVCTFNQKHGDKGREWLTKLPTMQLDTRAEFFCLFVVYLAAVASSLDVSSAHLVISDSAVQVGRPVADLVLDDGEAHLLQEAVAARTCGQ